MVSYNSVRNNLIYQAETIIDDTGGFQSPFGSSYVEAVAFGMLALQKLLGDEQALHSMCTCDVVNATLSYTVLTMADTFTAEAF